MSLPVVGDAKLGLTALGAAMEGYRTPADWTAYAQGERKAWDAYVADNVAHGNRPNSYAQAIGVVNDLCDPRDRVVTAAGGLPAEVTANWRTLDIGTVDVEFGFSCMGYEIAGGWGARIAQSEAGARPRHHRLRRRRQLPVDELRHLFICPDRKKLIVLVLDNGGFAVINKLQNNTGNESFNNLIAIAPPCPKPSPSISRPMPDPWAPMPSRWPTPPSWPRRSRPPRPSDKTTVIAMQVDPYDGWTTGRPHLVGGRHAAGLGQCFRARKACRDRGRTRQAAAGRLMSDLLRLRGKNFVIIGRAGMDFYPEPPGTRTEHATHFFACLGGSSANIGVALVKLGGKADLVTCVSDDAIGRFALNELDRYGVGRAHVRSVGGEARNSLAVVETTIEDHQSVIYRNDAADFEMIVDDVEASTTPPIPRLITTGTVFAAEPSRSAAFRAFELARAAGCR
jgi:hypothetical protein